MTIPIVIFNKNKREARFQRAEHGVFQVGIAWGAPFQAPEPAQQSGKESILELVCGKRWRPLRKRFCKYCSSIRYVRRPLGAVLVYGLQLLLPVLLLLVMPLLLLLLLALLLLLLEQLVQLVPVVLLRL